MAANTTAPFAFQNFAVSEPTTSPPLDQISSSWLEQDDHVGFSLHLVASGQLAAAIFFGLSAVLVPRAWTMPLAVLGCSMGIGWFVYEGLLKPGWQGSKLIPLEQRYIDWLLTFPLQLSLIFSLLSCGLPPDKIRPPPSLLFKWIGLSIAFLGFLYMGQTGLLDFFPSFILTIFVWLFLVADLKNGEGARLASLLSSDDARAFLRAIEHNQNAVRRRLMRQMHQELIAKKRKKEAKASSFTLGVKSPTSPNMSPSSNLSPNVSTVNAVAVGLNSSNAQAQLNMSLNSGISPGAISMVSTINPQGMPINNSNNSPMKSPGPAAANLDQSNLNMTPMANNANSMNQSMSSPDPYMILNNTMPQVQNMGGFNTDGTAKSRAQQREEEIRIMEQKRSDQLKIQRKVEERVNVKMNATALDDADFIKSSAESAFEWMRNILLVSWLLYPAAFAWHSEADNLSGINTIYSILDLTQKVAFGVALWAACNSYEQSVKQLDYIVFRMERLACNSYIRELKRRGIMHPKYTGTLLEWLKIDLEQCKANSMFTQQQTSQQNQNKIGLLKKKDPTAEVMPINDSASLSGSVATEKGGGGKGGGKPGSDDSTESEADSDLSAVQASAFTTAAKDMLKNTKGKK